MQLTVSVTEAVYKINHEEIIYLQACSNYTRIYLTEKRNIFSAKTLKLYENLLPTDIFYRVHSSYLINAKHIRSFDLSSAIRLTQNFRVPISRRKRFFIKNLLENKFEIKELIDFE
jgi:two-component system, LytTR family, response regulator